MAAKTWTCRRSTNGKICRHVNPKRKQLCEKCGKRRPATKREAHFDALKLPYEAFVLVNGGSHDCGICGREPKHGRRNDRDHEHVGEGLVRGILCHVCNRLIGARMEYAARQAGMDLPTYLRAMADYIERAERWRGINLKEFL